MLAFISFVLTLIVILISIIFYKLTFWSRQGIPNDLSSRSRLPFHLSDLESHRKYGKIVGFYEGLRPCLSVTDPKIIKRLLVTDFHYVPNHRVVVSSNEPLFKALFFMPYPEWKRIRTILSPSFSTGKLKHLQPSITGSLDSLIRKLESKAINKQIIDLRKYFDRMTFEVISKLAFGITTDSINNPDNLMFRSAKSLFESKQSLKKLLIVTFPFLNKYLDYCFFDKDIQNTLSLNVKRIIEERISKNIEIPDLLQMSIDSSQLSNKDIKTSFEKLSEEEVIAQSLNILGAGYETTSTQLCFIFRFLALNTEYQDLIYNEIQSTFGNISDIDYEKLMKMKFLDAFIKEIMRINCSVNRIDRIAITDYRIDNIFIPKGTSVIIPIWALHLDQDNFEDAQLFKPERFFPENEKNIKEYCYLPFASGPRNCIGMRLAQMEIKYIMVRLLTKFRIQATDRTNDLEFFKLNQVTNMKHVYLRLLKRKD